MALHALTSDWHLARRPPANCTETYLEDLLDLVEQILLLSREREVASLAIAGDTFHHKAPTRTEHGLVKLLTSMFLPKPPLPFRALAVPGNHDIQNDNLATLDRQPLGVLYAAGALEQLDGWAEGLPLFGVPWQQHWTEERIYEVLAPWREQVFERGTGRAHPLVVAHAPIYPPGQEPGYEGAEFTPASWWAGAMGSTGGLFYGHIHEPHGWWEHAGVQFCNNGALSRGSLDEHNLERDVRLTFWDDAAGDFRSVVLDARPASEVFRLAEHDKAVTSQGRLDDFLADINREVLPILTEAAVMARVREMNKGKPAEDLAEELLAWATHEGKPK